MRRLSFLNITRIETTICTRVGVLLLLVGFYKMKKEYIIKSVNVDKLINYVLKKDTNKKVKIKKTNEYTKK
jgi:hypothetical protein